MNDNERIYIADDDEARARGEWREQPARPARAEADAGMRMVAYLVLCAAFVVGGALFVGVLRLLGQ